MIFVNSNVLGIDVYGDRVYLALVGKTRDGIKVLKAASGPLPENAVSGGNVEDPVALAGAIRKLANRHKMKASRSAVALLANPVLTQVLDLPKDLPSNLREFVKEKVRHCAILPIKNVAMDYCGLVSDGNAARKALVVAADSRRIRDVVMTMNHIEHDLKVELVEPAPMAYVRACYEKKIAHMGDSNLLFIIAHNGVVTFCVFRQGTLDFVRTKRPEPEHCGTCMLSSDQCAECLRKEIEAVVQYYELEVPDRRTAWNVSVIVENNDPDVKQRIEGIQGNFDDAVISVIPFQEAFLDTPASDFAGEEGPSAIAVGLGMKLLGCGSGPDVNLLPPDAGEVKIARRNAWMIANSVAATVFLMILSVFFLQIKAANITGQLRQRQSNLDLKTRTILTEKRVVDNHIKGITSSLETVGTAFSTMVFVKWGDILRDLSTATPRNIRITRLHSDDNATMLLDVQAVSYEAVRRFVDSLAKCKHIQAVVLVGSQQDGRLSTMVRYSLRCTLSP